METRRLLQDELNFFGSVLGKHSLFIMILIIAFLTFLCCSLHENCLSYMFNWCCTRRNIVSYVEYCLVGGFCFVGHSLHCIKTKPEPSFSFVSYFMEYVIVVVSAL
jgi:hypothetical protein